jgi:drug/metabolite transporter (DMT)-like permease
MTSTLVSQNEQSAKGLRANLPTLLAFLTIYVVWGSTFLAIRVAVQQVPPLFAASVRFFLAGVALYAYLRLHGVPRPTLPEWRSLALLALLMFVLDYSAVFWAEQYVPSGVTSVLVATVPLITIIFEVFVLRLQAFQWPLLFAILLGFGGVSIVMLQGNGQQLSLLPCLAILFGSTSWAIGSVLTRSLRLPASKMLTAGAEMLIGGAVLLTLSACTGELHPFPRISFSAAVALIYLIVFGSLIGFTAYMWLLTRMPATRVASHAYVNPIVAVVLGYFTAHEVITWRTVLGTALVLTSVGLTLRKKASAR